jgi:hypothetical protein
LKKVWGVLVAAGYSAQLLGGASVATSIGWFGSTGPSLVWTSRSLVRVASSSDSTIAIVHNSRILGFSRVGLIDMRAQVEMPSARRPDTPRSVRVEAFGAEVAEEMHLHAAFNAGDDRPLAFGRRRGYPQGAGASWHWHITTTQIYDNRRYLTSEGASHRVPI